MCFSLPSPEDPFNKRQGKPDMTKKKAKKLKSRSKRENEKEPSPIPMPIDGDHEQEDRSKRENEKEPSPVPMPIAGDHDQEDSVEKSIFEKDKGQTKYLMSCLNEIESSFRVDGEYSDGDKSLFTSAWGTEFWKCFHSGKNVVETSGTSSTAEQIAWIFSTAVDDIARRERELPDESFSSNPFLLWLVPSQSKASEVKSSFCSSDNLVKN